MQQVDSTRLWLMSWSYVIADVQQMLQLFVYYISLLRFNKVIILNE